MRKFYKRRLLFMTIALSVSLMAGCGVQQNIPSKNKKEATKVKEEAVQEQSDRKAREEDFLFRDVFGKKYTTKILPNVDKSPYDKDKFVKVDGKMTYTGEGYKTSLGIDVSHHQGPIDWTRVKAAGYDFAFLRIAYRGYGQTGSLNQDRMFETYYQGAKAAGIDLGVYIYSQAINEAEAREEADFVLDILHNRSLQLPVVYDPENGLNAKARTDDVSGEQFTKNTIAFHDTIEKAGYPCMIYSNMLWEAFQFDLNQVGIYDIWYADYEDKPQTPYHFSYWQYTNAAKVPGVDGSIDADIRLEKVK